MVAITIVLFALYYVMPIDNRSETSGAHAGHRADRVLRGVGWQVRQILQGGLPPAACLVESAGTVVPLLIIVFGVV